jgi:N-methylhydantoinase A
MPTPPFTIGIDTGGTFTDLVRIDADGRLDIEKSFSTPAAPEDAVLNVLDRIAGADAVNELLAATTRFGHGTTVSTNALIQRKGARVGLLTTRGFEDTMVIARGPIGRVGGLPHAQAMDFLHTEAPAPLVPRRLTRGIGERVTVTGEVIAPVDPDDVRSALGELLEEGIDSLAVCLLWSFRAPAHERQIREIVAGMAPGLQVSLSSEIAPRIGEFERMVTTVVNAFIGPVTERYITSLQDKLADKGLVSPIQVMKCSGGVTLPDQVASQSVSVVNSGPIGGLVAARHVGRALGYDNVITCDMGGTSFDVGLIAGGVFEEDRQPFLDQGLPVLAPSIRVVTIGAGGGSIASANNDRLRVGPESAGADPGPACYGRGGTRPTVTDALVTLGVVDPTNFFGGRHALNADLAAQAIQEHVGDPLGMGSVDAAAGIYEVVTARMADLIRKVSIESGNDPRDFCLFAYGGASGAHCAAFAAQIGIRKIIVPYAGPVFSAYGVALSDVLYSHARSEPVDLATPDMAKSVNATFDELAARALADMAASGINQSEVTLSRRIEMRYRGQMNEVSIMWCGGRLDDASAETLRADFNAHYQQRFGAGTTRAEAPLELISFRVEAIRPSDKPPLAPLETAGRGGQPTRNRQVYLRGEGWLDAEIHDFDGLQPGAKISGPAVIERNNTTIWLPPGASAVLDPFGNVEIDTGVGA